MGEPCPACRHPRHRSDCKARVNWVRRIWRRLMGWPWDPTDQCGCYYWNAAWEAPAPAGEREKA